jgi:ABC-2 type transport system permease protein
MSGAPSLSFTLFRTYLKFYFQTKRFYAMLIVYMLIVFLTPALMLTNVIGKPASVSDFLGAPIGLFYELATLASALLAGDAISQDFSRHGLFTLSQPFGRARIMVTRYLSALSASAGLALAYFAVAAVTGYAYYGGVTPNYVEMVGLAILYVAALVAFVMLCSALFKSSSISIVVAVLLVILVMPFATGILTITNIEPWFFITYAGSAVPSLASQVYPPHMETTVVNATGTSTITITSYNPTVPEAVAIMAGYLLVSLSVSWFVYSRRELRET